MGRNSGLKSTFIVWGITLVVAIGIVVTAIKISKQKSEANSVSETVISQPFITQPNLTPIIADDVFSEEDSELPLAQEIDEQEEPKREEPKDITLDYLLSASYPGQIKLEVHSSGKALQEGLRYPLVHTCYYKNISPDIRYKSVPSASKSLAIIFIRHVDVGKYFLNWGLYNIDPGITAIRKELPNKKMPELRSGFPAAVQAKNDHRKFGYIGPCEPKGKINYSFHLFALDTELDKEIDMKFQDLLNAMQGHILDVSTFNIVHYKRI
jgi:Raf kinase inhibitor-like YbhB/YbcL family protein